MDQETWYKKLALRDLVEVRSANLLILDTLDVTPRGGREVELGIAVDRFQAIEIWLVGPKRNVFHRLADIHFNTWDECLEWLKPAPLPVPDVAEYDFDAALDAELLKASDAARDAINAEMVAEYKKRMVWLEGTTVND